MPSNDDLRVAVDIGGTFTDVVAVRGGDIAATKVLSTPDDLSRGVMAGIDAAVARLGARASDIDFVVHATTAATNALLERRGARVGLIVTDGFRDILEIGRQRRFDPYDLERPKLTPIVPRDRVVEVAGRMDAHGNELVALDEAAVLAALAFLERQEVDAIAVSFIHAYRDPRHEQRVLELAATALRTTGMPLFASHQVVPEAREYERTSTTVVAAYLSPVVRDYLGDLADRLARGGAPRRYWVMKSSGGLFDSQSARSHPEELVESGPAAGVIGAAAAARALEILDAVSFDMGGTTAKAALIGGGAARMNYEYEVGGAAHAGGFLQKGTGYPLRVPVIDLAEVGTGGGSVAWVDEGGALRIGPHSAGADPGPVCYGRGGAAATVTDADLVLGYLDEAGSGQFLGRLDAGAARAAIADQIAGPLDMSVEAAARGIFDLANAQMADAVRLVSVERGVDPRTLTLIAFGGAGPVHAWAIAGQLLIDSILVPPYPGVYSAVGLLGADFRLDLSRGVRIDLQHDDARAQLAAVFQALQADGRAAMLEQGHPAATVSLACTADMRYRGQSYEVNVAIGLAGDSGVDPAALRQAFHAAHAQRYGHASEDEPVEVITARVTAAVPGHRVAFTGGGDAARTSLAGERPIAFDGVTRPTTVIARDTLTGTLEGPAAIEQADTTIIVPPAARARAGADGFLRIDLGGQQR